MATSTQAKANAAIPVQWCISTCGSIGIHRLGRELPKPVVRSSHGIERAPRPRRHPFAVGFYQITQCIMTVDQLADGRIRSGHDGRLIGPDPAGFIAEVSVLGARAIFLSDQFAEGVIPHLLGA